MSDEPRLLAVTPIFTHMLPKAYYAFTAMWLRTARDLTGWKIDVMDAERQLLHMAMNRAVEALLENPAYTAMVMLDDDCLPPADGLVRLIRHFEAGHPFVSAMGYMRKYPYTTTVGKYYKEGPTYQEDSGQWSGFYWLDKLPSRHRGLWKADFCGFPMTVVGREIFEAIEKPAFGHTDGLGGHMTHDIFFCKRVQAAGYDILVDTSVECSHISEPPIIDGTTREAARAAIAWGQQAKAEATVTTVTAQDAMLEEVVHGE